MKIDQALYEFKPWILLVGGLVGYNQLQKYAVGRYSSILLILSGVLILWVRWYYRRRKAQKERNF